MTKQNHILAADFSTANSNGLFQGIIHFEAGLNIISGENGTGKTKLLQAIKNGSANRTFYNSEGSPRLQAISPRRNSEFKATQAILQDIRQQNRNKDFFIAESNISDRTFERYPSLGELFYAVFDDLCRDGGDQKNKMNDVTLQFNNVITRIFENSSLKSEWNSTEGKPNIKLIKKGGWEVPIEGLSLGEQEILSLVLSLDVSKDTYNIFLIDEPEVHLNWYLEEKLFNYLDYFCEEYYRQIIVVTHSRAIFTSKFLPKTQFLYWDHNDKVTCSSEITEEQRRRIAGEAIDIIKLGDFSKPTFFVEDDAHEKVLTEISKVFEVKINITKCGNSSNVKSLYEYSKREGEWKDTFFLVDGDNQGNTYRGEKRFIHLSKYCIENFLINFEVMAELTSKSIEEVKEIVLECIKETKTSFIKGSKFFEALISNANSTHMTSDLLDSIDASETVS